MLIDTGRTAFDIRQIENRRFMFSPQSGELILGRQYKGNQLYASHAEEHGKSGAKAPYDSFIRGWVGAGRQYPHGVIHFAPNVESANVEQFERHFPRWKCSGRTVRRARPLFGALGIPGNSPYQISFQTKKGATE